MSGDVIFVSPTTTVVLHGALAKKYGRRHTLGVRTAPQAAYALCTMVPGFREEFQDGWYRVVRGRVADGVVLSERELHLQVPRGGEIHFIPVARGGKNSGGIKAVLGAVILVAAVVASAGALAPLGIAGGGLAATSALGVSYGSIAFFGATMLLSGVSALLSSTNSSLNNMVDAKQSYSLTGNTNSTTEGTPIPVVYGRTRVGSVVGSFGYYAEDYDGISPPSASTVAGIAGGTGAIGSKGSKGGASGGASEAPNTLRSRAVVRLIDILSEGPIGGLVNGARSIYFNNTPLMASDGSYNFQGVTWEVRLGYPSQDPVAGYPASELTAQVGTEVEHLGAGAIVRTYTSSTADAARVTIRLPALTHLNANNGNLEAYPLLHYTIEVAPTGTNAYQTVVSQVLANQKTTSPYERSHRFDLPPGGTWDIRVTKITGDATNANDQCSVIWLATTLVTDQAQMHPNVAYVALTIDSAAFGSQIPTRGYEIDGILCQIPANYDPVSGSYATSGPGTSLGTWDGASMKLATTSNPAWCLYDMLVNGRYGMGLPSDTAVANTKFDLFVIGQYADGTVPSGFTDANGNMMQERRYTLNTALTQQVDAYRLLQSMVSAFRGMTYWGAGRVVVTADMPAAPSYALHSGNVMDGDFTYEGSPLKSRHTVARVSWIDPNNSYQQAIEVVEDFDNVVSQGQVPTDILAFGCTSRGLARRWGKWLLDTERHQTELVSCGVGLEQLRSRPGDVVRVADPAYSGIRQGGRVLAGSQTGIVKLDQAFPNTPGLSYFLTVSLPDGTIIDKTPIGNFVPGPNGTTAVVLVTPLAAAPLPGAAWIISSTGPSGLQPTDTRQFRVLALSEPHRGQYQISGVLHDPNKYARVELGLEFDPTPFSTLNGLLVAPLPAPKNVAARDYMVGVGSTQVIRVSVGWTPANDVRVVGQQVHTDGPEQRDLKADGSSIDIDGLQVGTYTFRVRSVGRDGRTSVWSDSAQIYVDGQPDPPDAPLNFTVQGGAMQVRSTWNNSSARDIRHYELWRAPAAANGQHPFPYDGYNPVGTPQANSASLVVKVAATAYTDIGDYLAPDTAWAYWVRAVNLTGGVSAFTGPVKALTTYYISDNLEAGIRNTAPIAEALLGSAPLALKDLSSPGHFDGQLALNASDQKLYRWDGTANNGLGAWALYLPVVPNKLGQITDASIASLDATKIAGSFTSEQAASVVNAMANGAITDRMIANLAGSKIQGTLSNATMQAGRIYDVDPLTGEAVQGVDVSKLLGNIVGTRIVDGSITAEKIGANQVTALHVAAGTVTANALAVAGPGNVIGNPNCAATAWGWRLTESGSALGYVAVGSVTGEGAAPAQWALDGEGSGAMSASGTMAPGDFMQIEWDPDLTGGTPCQAGDWWEVQAYFGAHRCFGLAGLHFYDDTGTLLGGISSARIAGVLGGGQLSGYGFAWTKARAPDTAVRVRMFIRAGNDGADDIVGGTAGSNPYLFFTHAMLAPSSSHPLSGGAEPQPFTLGGVTQVVGGNIKTGAIAARQVSAGAIDATKLSVGSVSNVITNSCCTVSASSWLSTGAISAVPVYSQWLLTGYGTGQFIVGGLAAGQTFDTSWAPSGVPYKPDGTHAVQWGAAVSCNPGELWEAQARVITAGCSSTLFVLFLAKGTDGSWQLASAPTTGAQAWATPADGRSLGQYHQQSIRGTAPGPGTYGGVSCPNGATLVTLMLRMGNDSASQAVFGSGTQSTATIYFTQSALGIAQTAAAPMEWAPGGATQIDGGTVKTGTIVAGALAVGSVTAANLQAGAISTDTLAAGSITAGKLAIGTGTNLIWNACPDQGVEGWNIFQFGSLPGVNADGRVRAGPASQLNATFKLIGSGSGLSYVDMAGAPVNTGSGIGWDWNPTGVPYGGGYGVPAQAGTNYIGSAWVISLGFNVAVQIIFFDYNGNVLTAPGSPYTLNNSGGGGQVLDQYTRISCNAVAPGGTVTAAFRILGVGTNAQQPYFVFTQAAFGPAPPGTTIPPAWEPGGVSTMSGGMIKTNSLSASRIISGTITATQIQAGAISADRLQANSITAGQIQAGAIAADQIAANAIRATHLATDFALISSAQIGTAVIDSANIKHLALGKGALAYGAVGHLNYGVDTSQLARVAAYAAQPDLGDFAANQGCGLLLIWRTEFYDFQSSVPSAGGEGG